MTWRFAQLIALLFLLAIAAFAQRSADNGQLIDTSKPPVYIEFLRTGKCRTGGSNFNFGDLCNSKDVNSRTYNAAWLRFVNNSRWSVGLTVDKAATEKNSSPVVIESTTFVDEDGEKAAYGTRLAHKGAEMDIVYKSEVETGCDFSKKAPKGKSCFRIQATAPTIPLPAISSDLFIAPGQSVLFPVDRAHVREYVNLYVLYNFSWEYSGKFFSHFPHYDSQHRAYFGWFDLEKGIKSEGEKVTVADLR